MPVRTISSSYDSRTGLEGRSTFSSSYDSRTGLEGRSTLESVRRSTQGQARMTASCKRKLNTNPNPVSTNRATHPPNPLDLCPRPDEQCVALTTSFRILQRYRGHRYSVDDMLVAYVAGSHAQCPKRVLDLGCGLGSVLLMLAWRFPTAQLVGVEAQPEHVALARRNVLLNSCEHRASVIEGDLRFDPIGTEIHGHFDLVTATPPYFNPQTATICADPQRAFAQWELRGGIEDYAHAASKVMSSGGCFVTCSAASPEGRTERALEQSGLYPMWRCEVLPRPDRKPFLSLWIATRNAGQAIRQQPPLVLRQSDGTRTAEHIRIREWFGIPCSPR